MKEIKDMNVGEIASFLETGEPSAYSLEQRLRELHEQTRWIPVSERLPTKEDADRNTSCVLAWDEIDERPRAVHWLVAGTQERYTHWQRITPPEGV